MIIRALLTYQGLSSEFAWLVSGVLCSCSGSATLHQWCFSLQPRHAKHLSHVNNIACYVWNNSIQAQPKSNAGTRNISKVMTACSFSCKLSISWKYRRVDIYVLQCETKNQCQFTVVRMSLFNCDVTYSFNGPIITGINWFHYLTTNLIYPN